MRHKMVGLALAAGLGLLGCEDPGSGPDPTVPLSVTPTEGTPSPTEGSLDATPTAEPPTQTQVGPTATPEVTAVPTLAPTDPPTAAPTEAPTEAPTLAPTDPPTDAPTAAPTLPMATDTPTPTAAVDADGDGVPLALDCDDGDAAVHPGAQEVCTAPGETPKDEDCDGLEGDADPSASGKATFYLDLDHDGYGNDAAPTATGCQPPPAYALVGGDCDDGDAAYNPGASEDDCADPNDYNCDGSVGFSDADGDGYAACLDCDDGDAAVHPGAAEVCNGQDDDCDELVDDADDDRTGGAVSYADEDGDGYGLTASAASSCQTPEGRVTAGGDCDDAKAQVHPSADELCNEADDDCDARVDEAAVDPSTWYTDGDHDGYGVGAGQQGCAPPPGSAAVDGDCDDRFPGVHPGADEICDGRDNDCDDDTDEGVKATWYLDRDGDGYGDDAVSAPGCSAPAPAYVSVAGDCDDLAAAVNPGAEEGCDGGDYDCDGEIDHDGDGDGYADGACGGDDCDDADETVFPSQGGCALGATCLDILQRGKSVGSGEYTLDPDGHGGAPAFTAVCDMETDGGGWTGARSTNTPTEQKHWFSGGDAYHWLPFNFTYDLTSSQLAAVRALSTEAEQDVVFHCYHVIAHYYQGGDNYDYDTHWASEQGGLTSLLTPSWTLDDCSANDSVWRESHASFGGLGLPVYNVEVRDAGDDGEYYGIDVDTAWFR